MTEVKRCPFCGGLAEIDKNNPNMAYCIDGISGADNENKKCYNDAVLSVEDWNNRPFESELKEDIEKLNETISIQKQFIGRLIQERRAAIKELEHAKLV